MSKLRRWDGRFPRGRKRGLKRDTKARIAERCDPIRRAAGFEPIPERHWDELARTQWHEDKRQDYRYILDQNGVGSCASESAAATKAALDARQNLPMVVYNPWSIYWYTSGGRDAGSVIGDNVEYLRDKGICPEEIHPRSLGWRAEPSREAKRIAKLFRIVEFFSVENISELVSALLQGFNVHAGYSGHAISFTQYLGRRELLFCNSWGIWGDEGFGTLPTSRVYFPYGAFAYKHVFAWTKEDWSPQYDQAALAKAVAKFVVAANREWRQVWRRRADGRREELYNQALRFAGRSLRAAWK